MIFNKRNQHLDIALLLGLLAYEHIIDWQYLNFLLILTGSVFSYKMVVNLRSQLFQLYAQHIFSS